MELKKEVLQYVDQAPESKPEVDQPPMPSRGLWMIAINEDNDKEYALGDLSDYYMFNELSAGTGVFLQELKDYLVLLMRRKG